MWRVTLAREFAIRETLSADLRHGKRKTLTVTHVLAIVKSESLLIKVTEKMKWFYANVGSRVPAIPRLSSDQKFSRPFVCTRRASRW